MKLRNFNPHGLDNVNQRRNQQTLASASFAHVGPINVLDSTALQETTDATAFDQSYTIPRQLMHQGDVCRLLASGKYSTKAGSTPSLTLAVKLGGLELCSTGAVVLGDGVTDKAWVLRITLQCRASGDEGQFIAFLEATFDGVPVHKPASAPITLSTNDNLLLEVVGTWSAADASNTATLQMLVPEHL